MPAIPILNISVIPITTHQLLKQLDKGALFTPNLDHLVKLQHDRDFYNAYQQAEWVVCDSRILYFSSKLLPAHLPASVSGSSFFTAFYQYHKNDPDCRIFLLGARAGVAQKAQQRINRKAGRNIVVGARSPSFGFENNPDECNAIVQAIRQSHANVLLVGVGAPKQEKWIARYRQQLPSVKLFFALGATIDFEAGTVKRAPKLVQKLALEWLYRFLKEPKRLFKRYFIDDIQFFYYFARQLLGSYRNPFA